MKKLLLAFALAASMVFSAAAQETEQKESTPRVWDHGDNVSDILICNVRMSASIKSMILRKLTLSFTKNRVLRLEQP